MQLRLYHLAVASVEKCEALVELEGAASVGPAPGAGAAFKTLKQLVHNWLVDTMQTNNKCALATPLTQECPCNRTSFLMQKPRHWERRRDFHCILAVLTPSANAVRDARRQQIPRTTSLSSRMT